MLNSICRLILPSAFCHVRYHFGGLLCSLPLHVSEVFICNCLCGYKYSKIPRKISYLPCLQCLQYCWGNEPFTSPWSPRPWSMLPWEVKVMFWEYEDECKDPLFRWVSPLLRPAGCNLIGCACSDSGGHLPRKDDGNVVSWKYVTEHSYLLLTGSGSFGKGKVESLHYISRHLCFLFFFFFAFYFCRFLWSACLCFPQIHLLKS